MRGEIQNKVFPFYNVILKHNILYCAIFCQSLSSVGSDELNASVADAEVIPDIYDIEPNNTYMILLGKIEWCIQREKKETLARSFPIC